MVTRIGICPNVGRYSSNAHLILNRLMSTQEPVIFKSTENVGLITLNRPKVLNAFNGLIVNKIQCKLEKWRDNKSLVIINGAGKKAFCAGGDVVDVTNYDHKDRGQNVQLLFDIFKNTYTLNGYIARYKVPFVALIDGIVMGGGAGLSVLGRYRVATERTLFSMPETSIGFHPNVGSSYFLPKLQGKLGIYLGLTGHRLTGSDVYKVGIATHFCESIYIEELTQSLLRSRNDEDVKKILDKFHQIDINPFSLNSLMPKINKCFGGATIEEIFKELEMDGSEWAVDVLKNLSKMSPTSLKITVRSFEKGAKLSLDECLKMDYRLTVGCLKNNDFYEGVRALLIDKDYKPKWNPTSINDIPDQYIDSYFNILSEEHELKHKF